MGHSHCLKAIFFHVFHSNTIHFIMPAGKLMQSSTSCTSMVIVWGCFKGCWAWEMLYRSYSYCETAVFFNGVPTFNFSSSMNKLEVLSAAKARHLLLVLVYRERSAIYTLYKPWSSINSAWFHKTSAWLQKETATESLWHWFKKWKYFWNMLDCYNIQSFFSFQRLSGSHKALVEMQDDVFELLRSATREYIQTKVCFLHQ